MVTGAVHSSVDILNQLKLLLLGLVVLCLLGWISDGEEIAQPASLSVESGAPLSQPQSQLFSQPQSQSQLLSTPQRSVPAQGGWNAPSNSSGTPKAQKPLTAYVHPV